MTIQSVLGLQPIYNLDTGEQRLRQTGPANLPPRALLVVDECSMVGRELFAHLLRATTRAEAQVLFVGDPAQLPRSRKRSVPPLRKSLIR